MLGIYLPLITTNCAVLGVALLNVQEKHGFVESLLYGFGSALGFTLVLVLFAGLRERLALAQVPEAFAGAPIGFITAGLLSLAFMGFAGLASMRRQPVMIVRHPQSHRSLARCSAWSSASPRAFSRWKATRWSKNSKPCCPVRNAASAAIPAAPARRRRWPTAVRRSPCVRRADAPWWWRWRPSWVSRPTCPG